MRAPSGIEVLANHAITGTSGKLRVDGVTVMQLARGGVFGEPRSLSCDLVLHSGGWTPSVHLFSQSRGKLHWDEALAAFVPGVSGHRRSVPPAAAAAVSRLGDCLHDGHAAGAAAAKDAGVAGDAGRAPSALGRRIHPCHAGLDRALRQAGRPNGKQFVDFQNDVTAADVLLAEREGYRSVEHLKRYTAMGMGTDQGKTSNINALGILAEAQGRPMPEVGHTTFRPPYTPVTFGAFAGDDHGELLDPVRRTPIHHWHEGATRRSRTSASGSAPGTTRSRAKTCTPRSSAKPWRCAAPSASSMPRPWARSISRAPMPPSC